MSIQVENFLYLHLLVIPVIAYVTLFGRIDHSSKIKFCYQCVGLHHGVKRCSRPHIARCVKHITGTVMSRTVVLTLFP